MITGDKPHFLIETALLTHGLFSISIDEISELWGGAAWPLVFLDEGKLRVEYLDAYLPYREKLSNYPRLDCDALREQRFVKSSGSLTASATMAVCHEMGFSVAVTAGMGGIGDIEKEGVSADLFALSRYPVLLIDTAPKDMLDYEATFDWIRKHNIKVHGTNRDICDGFMFVREQERLSGKMVRSANKGLLLHDIPTDQRFTNPEGIKLAIQAGKDAEREGKEYHPAANRKFDEMTVGESSHMQLRALIANANLLKPYKSDRKCNAINE